MNRLARQETRYIRAFTLIELLVSIFIISVLIGLLIVGMRHAFASARQAAGIQDVNALKVAVQVFKGDHGFLPPLVQDGYPNTPDTAGPLITVGSRTVPNVYRLADATDRAFLQNDAMSPDYRFSVYSLAYYIMGALDKSVDGVEGPGARKPKRDGSFDFLANETYDALFEPKTGQVAFAPWQASETAASGRFELQDRNGVAYRYYRWQHGTPAVGDDERGVLNVPDLVEVAKDRVELGDAAFAIVAAGADGVFGEICSDGNACPKVETFSQVEDALNKNFAKDPGNPTPEEIERAEAAARKDNIVEIGR